MTLAAFYVLVSRVREAAGLRLLQYDEVGLDAVEGLKSDQYLYAWECGYDEDGCWDVERAASALRGQRMAREQARAHAKKAAERRAEVAHTRQGSVQPARREKSEKRQPTRPAARPPGPAGNNKRAYACSVCQESGHKARRVNGVAQCPRVQQQQEARPPTAKRARATENDEIIDDDDIIIDDDGTGTKRA